MIKEQASFFLKRVIVRAEKSDSRLSNAPKPYPVLPDEETAVLLLPAQSHDLDLKTTLGAAILKAQCLCHLDPWKWKLLEPGSPCSSLPFILRKSGTHSLMVREAGNLRFDELFLQI